MNRKVGLKESDDTIEDFASGTVLFREGEQGACAYIIEAGIVEISTSIRGDRCVLKMLGPGEIFGEMAIIDDAARSATATVVVDSKLRVIHRLQLQERLRHADPILNMLMRLITTRYRFSVAALKESTVAQEIPDLAEPKAVTDEAVDKFRMEGRLRNAVKNRCLSVVYQPIVDLCDSRVVGYEALVRWRNVHQSFVPPQVFIPLAEETNLIRAIDEFVFKEATDGIRHINRCSYGEAGIFIAINVSARQLEDNRYLDMARDFVRKIGFAPELVTLEITESQIAQEENAESWISTAKAYGFRVALDDFGTGFSSLSQLLRLNVDRVKIDQSFVHKLGQIERGEAMIRGIIALAKSMRMSVVAEGIETAGQQSVLTQADCPFGQGYHLGKPMPLEEILSAHSLSSKGVSHAGTEGLSLTDAEKLL